MLTIIHQRIFKKIHTVLLGNTSEFNVFYFGYGANIHPEFLKKRIRHFEVVGVGYLSDYKFLNNVPCEYVGKGFGGISPFPGERVYGTVYKINSRNLRLLDWLEWVPFKFYRRELLKLETQNGSIEAHTYIPLFPRDNLKTSVGYKQMLINGAVKMKFPESYIDYLKSLETADRFDLDHSFNLAHPGKKRLFPPRMCVLHDRLREKLCSLI